MCVYDNGVKAFMPQIKLPSINNLVKYLFIYKFIDYKMKCKHFLIKKGQPELFAEKLPAYYRVQNDFFHLSLFEVHITSRTRTKPETMYNQIKNQCSQNHCELCSCLFSEIVLAELSYHWSQLQRIICFLNYTCHLLSLCQNQRAMKKANVLGRLARYDGIVFAEVFPAQEYQNLASKCFPHLHFTRILLKSRSFLQWFNKGYKVHFSCLL